jgi:hypothetical protein
MKLRASVRSAIALPLVVLIVVLGTAAGPVFAAGVCHVWQDSPSPGAPYDTWDTAAHDIQTAIDHASANLATYDTVLVTNGTYSVSAQLSVTNAVTLTSVAGADQTIVKRAAAGSADPKHRVLYLDNAGAIIEKLTLKGGYLTSGEGAGVWLQAGTLRDCTVRDNDRNNGFAGGIEVDGGLVQRCRVENNRSRWGGGARAEAGTIEDCTFVGNEANLGGGGDGGGLTVSGSGVVVRRCSFSANIGNGIRQSAGTIENALVVGNTGGAGVSISGGTLQHATVVDNEANSAGAGLRQTGGIVRNSIVYHNRSTPDNPELNNVYKTGGTLTCSCMAPLVAESGNTAANPTFVDRAGGDYRLGPGSPCIDTGMTIAAVTDDIEGAARPLDGDGTAGAAADMGAFEAPAYASGALRCAFATPLQLCFDALDATLTASVAGTNLSGLVYCWDFTNDGSFDAIGGDKASVSHTYGPGIHDVRLVVTNSVGETAVSLVPGFIEVGARTNYVWSGGSNTHPYDTWDRAAHSIQSAVAAAVVTGGVGAVVMLADGLHGVAAPLSVTKRITLTSANGRDNTVIARTNGTIRLLTLNHAAAVVNGLAFAGGNAGAVQIDAGTMRSCIVTNTAGWGVTLNAGLLEDSTIARNSGRYGSGVAMSSSPATVRRCLIEQNKGSYGDGSGDGIGITMTVAGLVENCIIRSNTVNSSGNSGDGAGARLTKGTLRNCLVVGNSATATGNATARGGGLVVNGGTVLVENCTIADNTAATSGGGIELIAGTVRNCISYGNTCAADASLANVRKTGGVFTYSCSTPLVSEGSDVFNTDGDPKFRNAAAHVFSLMAGSSALNVGLCQEWMVGATDLAGAPRIRGDAVDMGCFEFQPSGGTVVLVR